MTAVPGRSPGEPGGTHRRRDPLIAVPRAAVAVPRAAVAVLVLAALAWSSLEAARAGTLPQHVSFFTNQSNFAFALVMLAMAILPQARPPRWWEHLRGAVVFYLAMTGIIYALLVAPLDELLRWDIGWQGIVLHRLAPVVAVADWLLTPRRRSPGRARLLTWQIYPVLFLAATWIRGAVTGWYPYAFLDPTASSWGQVLLTTAVVLIAFLTIALAIHLLEGRLRPRPSTPEPPLP